MTLEIKYKIGNITEAKEGLNYEVRNSDFEIIDSNTLTTKPDGTVSVKMAGKPATLNQDLILTVHDFNGSNFSTFGHAMFNVTVEDDGVAPPDVLKLIAIGDSFTETSNINTGLRASKGNVTMYFSNYWATAAYVHSANDFIFRPDMGKSGQTTRGALSILSQYQGSDADVVMLLLGTNDFNNIPAAETRANYESIVNGLLVSGKKVLIIPVYKRNNGGSTDLINVMVDEFNAYILSMFGDTDGVFFSDVDDEINNLMLANGNNGVVSSDGLHFNNAGGMLAGVNVAKALDRAFSSTMQKVNLVGNGFSGTGGQAVTTGVMPDGFFGSLATNSTEDSFQGPIDRGDGKVWWKVRTNGEVNSSQSLFGVRGVPTTDGMYQMECLVEFEQGAELVTRVEARVGSTGPTWNASDLNTETVVGVVGQVENGKPYRFRSPTGVMDSTSCDAQFETKQSTGIDVIYYITDFMFYKVEDEIVL